MSCLSTREMNPSWWEEFSVIRYELKLDVVSCFVEALLNTKATKDCKMSHAQQTSKDLAKTQKHFAVLFTQNG